MDALTHDSTKQHGRCANAAAKACAILLGAITGFGGCAGTPGLIFDPADGVHLWPAPPDKPRVRYVGQLMAERDLKASRGGLGGVSDAIFGKETAAGMVSPLAVCTDGASRVFVSDSGRRGVHVFDLSSRRYELWPKKGQEAMLGLPVGVAYNAAAGELMVSDAASHTLVVFDQGGKVVRTIGEAYLTRPCGLVWDAVRQRVIVVDSAAHQVVALDARGDLVQRLGRRGGGPGEFNFPTYIAQDERGRLYVSDSLNFRVQVLDAALSPVAQFGKKGDMPGYFSQPKGIAIGPGGRVYVADANFEAVQVFESDGTLLMTFGREGRGPGEFWLPVGMHVDGNGRIWVADSYNKRVQAFDVLAESVNVSGEVEEVEGERP